MTTAFQLLNSVPGFPSGLESHDLSRAASPDCGIGADFLFFYKVTAHDYLYWAQWAATESNPLRGGEVGGGGCEHAQSGTRMKQEGGLTCQDKQKENRGRRWQS